MPFKIKKKTRYSIDANYFRVSEITVGPIEETCFVHLRGWAAKTDFSNKGEPLLIENFSHDADEPRRISYKDVVGKTAKQLEIFIQANFDDFKSAILED